MQQAFNGMLTLLLAKFVLNDVPHALRLTSNPGRGQAHSRPPEHWVRGAWSELVEHVISRGVSPTVITKTLNAYPFSPEEEAEGMEGGVLLYKTVMGGYYLLSQGRATDHVVDEVYRTIQRMVKAIGEGVEERRGPYYLDESMLERLEAWETLSEEERRERAGTYMDESDIRPWLDGWYQIKASLRDGSRFDKVFTIETFIHAEHVRGLYMEYCWGEMWPEVSDLTAAILDVLGKAK